MAKYAEGTSVPVSQTRTEIERTLKRYGATAFMYGEEGNHAMIAFQIKERHIRITLNYPASETFRMRGFVTRTNAQMKSAHEQEIKRLWRSLAMIIKAKLEAVESGITTIEEEFLSNIIMSNNQTVGEWLQPQIASMYENGRMPPLLPGPRVHAIYEGEIGS